MPLIGLAMAFATLLVVANIVSVKLISIGNWAVPAGVVAYPFTFLVSDTIAELYGRRTAVRVVWLGFAMSLVMVTLVYVARVLPPASFWDGQPEYDAILGAVPRIVLASMIAYLISQHHDVFAFHLWRRVTRGKHLWLRNNASTAVSQAMDTVLFITIAFAGTVPTSVLLNLIATQYVIKLLIAALDTPFVYMLVGLFRRIEASEEDTGVPRPVAT